MANGHTERPPIDSNLAPAENQPKEASKYQAVSLGEQIVLELLLITRRKKTRSLICVLFKESRGKVEAKVEAFGFIGFISQPKQQPSNSQARTSKVDNRSN